MNCVHCGKETLVGANYCDSACMIANAKAIGGKEFSPNGLPTRSIRADGNMYEHEHGDHPDYKYPVEVEFVGEIGDDDRADFEMIAGRPAESEEELRRMQRETHALIYTDGFIAVTMYEHNYAMWSVGTGAYRGGRYASNAQRLKVPLRPPAVVKGEP